MRRSEKEINNKTVIEQVMARAQVCRLGISRDNQPYIVPVAFGYDGKAIYFHTALEGMLIDYLIANPRVCFELEDEVNVIPHRNQACKWSFSFYSIIGFGNTIEITNSDHKIAALDQIMRQYSEREWKYTPEELAKIRIWSIVIESVTGKQSADKIMM
jgi:uncharacterized protein